MKDDRPPAAVEGGEWRAVFSIRLDRDAAPVAAAALEPEAVGEGSIDVAVRHSGGILEVEIRAGDMTELKAALNSYLRLIHTVVEAKESLRGLP